MQRMLRQNVLSLIHRQDGDIPGIGQTPVPVQGLQALKVRIFLSESTHALSIIFGSGIWMSFLSIVLHTWSR